MCFLASFTMEKKFFEILKFYLKKYDVPLIFQEKGKDKEGNERKEWDFDRFDPAFFQHLEKSQCTLRSFRFFGR